MDVKPRSTSGHLLSVHGKKDYLVLEMINGTIKFLVKTQKGLIETSYEPTKPNSLCDGHWHNIRGNKSCDSLSPTHMYIQFNLFTGYKMINFQKIIILIFFNNILSLSWINLKATSFTIAALLFQTAVKQKNAVLLSVDHKPVPPGISGKNMGRVLSRQPIYIGGHLLLRRGLQGSTSQAQYVGCINNIQINSKPIGIRPERAYGQVVAGVCPTI